MSVHPALELARQSRYKDDLSVASPHELYRLSEGDTKLYKHAMVEAGHIVDSVSGKPHDPCPICKWSVKQQAPQEGLF